MAIVVASSLSECTVLDTWAVGRSPSVSIWFTVIKSFLSRSYFKLCSYCSPFSPNQHREVQQTTSKTFKVARKVIPHQNFCVWWWEPLLYLLLEVNPNCEVFYPEALSGSADFVLDKLDAKKDPCLVCLGTASGGCEENLAKQEEWRQGYFRGTLRRKGRIIGAFCWATRYWGRRDYSAERGSASPCRDQVLCLAPLRRGSTIILRWHRLKICHF